MISRDWKNRLWARRLHSILYMAFTFNSRAVLAAGLALALTALAGCEGSIGPQSGGPGSYTSNPGTDDRGRRGTQAAGGLCCVWIDLDGTLNTVGAFGYPFNPVPADELCKILAAKKPQVRSAFLTARKGCLPAFKPGEASCQKLEDTVSVDCSLSGTKMAEAKQKYLEGRKDCAGHILVDNNKAAAKIKLSVPYSYIEPKAFSWSSIRSQILNDIQSCTTGPGAGPGPAPNPAKPGGNPANPGGNPANPGGNPANPGGGPGPLTCQGHCGNKAPSGCWCDAQCKTKGDCCPDFAAACPAMAAPKAPNKGGGGPGPLTCQGHCGKQAPSGCWCDPFCKTKGDCCPDFGAACPANTSAQSPKKGSGGPGPLTCQGHCGNKAPSGCWCDAQCKTKGDCCPDVGPRCGVY